ncbi:MAG: hypothetical protein IPM51_11820 [Sphingobacteriaceae bacterium]|nr:hypothetical protein [Sphingobacteriaceae bacterium]
MPFEQLFKDYLSRKIDGVFLDTPDFSADVRKLVKYSRDEFFANAEQSPYFGDRVDYISEFANKEGVALPFSPVLDVDKDSFSHVQKTGDCYSHATKSMLDINRKNERLNGYESAFIEESATCLIYALRGRRGEGMTLYEVINALKGGIILEKLYELNGKTFDLREYDNYWRLGAQNWVNNVPREILQEAAKFPIKNVVTVSSMEEIRAGLFAGRAFSCGSSINPSTTRNEYGICTLQRSPIAHAMLICGVDTRKKYHRENLYLWDNSWPPNFYRGNTPIHGEEFGIKLPPCCYLLSESDTWRAVKEKGTLTASTIEGFPPLKLPNLGTTGRI